MIKLVLIALALGLATTSVSAEQTTEKRVAEVCSAVASMAEQMLRAKYRGASQEQVAAVLKPENTQHFYWLDKAYQVPYYDTYEERNQALTRFHNDALLECLDTL